MTVHNELIERIATALHNSEEDLRWCDALRFAQIAVAEMARGVRTVKREDLEKVA